MNEEIRNDENYEVEDTKYVPAETNEEQTESGSGPAIAIAVGVVGLVAGGIAAYRYKTREKREAKMVEKLKKKGYTIVNPDEKVIIEHVVEEEVVETTAEPVTETAEETTEE